MKNKPNLRHLVDLVSIRVHSWLTSICKTSETGGSRRTKKSQKVRKSFKNVQILTKLYKKRASIRANSRALVAKLKEQSQSTPNGGFCIKCGMTGPANKFRAIWKNKPNLHLTAEGAESAEWREYDLREILSAVSASSAVNAKQTQF